MADPGCNDGTSYEMRSKNSTTNDQDCGDQRGEGLSNRMTEANNPNQSIVLSRSQDIVYKSNHMESSNANNSQQE